MAMRDFPATSFASASALTSGRELTYEEALDFSRRNKRARIALLTLCIAAPALIVMIAWGGTRERVVERTRYALDGSKEVFAQYMGAKKHGTYVEYHRNGRERIVGKLLAALDVLRRQHVFLMHLQKIANVLLRGRADARHGLFRGGIDPASQRVDLVRHILLRRGLVAMESLLPGLEQEMLDHGGRPFNTGQMPWLGEHGWMPQTDWSYPIISLSRPLLEHLVRRRVRALPAVEFRS